MTALMWATRVGRNDVILRLIQAGASVDRKSGEVCM